MKWRRGYGKHDRSDPVTKKGDAGVQPRSVGLGTADSPAAHAHLHSRCLVAALLYEERAARVAFAGVFAAFRATACAKHPWAVGSHCTA